MNKREHTGNDVRQLKKSVLSLMDEIESVAKQVTGSYESVAKAIQNVLEESYKTELTNIPVERLNENKSGIRVSLFRKTGYTNVYSIMSAGSQRLSLIKGISPQMAEMAVRIAYHIASGVRSNLKIQVNIDHKTSAYTQLVMSIARYRQLQCQQDITNKIFELLPENPQKEMNKLNCMKNGLRWTLASKTRQNSALEAYSMLCVVVDKASGFKEQLDGLREQRFDAVLAWEDFRKNPVEFNYILEKTAPDRFSNTDDGYGISKELRNAVETTSIHLNGLMCQLRGYQVWGVKYILRQRRVLLGDEMGLGKTIQALAAMISIQNDGGSHFLVVCPASVIENWCREISSKSDMKVYNLHDLDRLMNLKQWIESGGVGVINYESLKNHFRIPETMKIDMVVVDEAHFIKNPQAQRTQSVLNVCDRSERLLFMTGTPLENHVSEMIGLMRHLQPAVAAKASRYASDYRAEVFKQQIAPVYYRRKRVDVLSELPELVENKEWCRMTRDDEYAYESDVLTGSFMQARRVSWTNKNFLNTSSKVQRMRELVSEAENEDRKVIVFSFFLETLSQIKEVFGERCVGVISGEIPIPKRQGIIDMFEGAPAGTVLAAQIQSGGTGLNIQTASVVIICEPQYKPSTENQAISRAYRMGQTRDVIVYRLLCLNSVDERVTQILERKQKDFDTYADESIAAKDDAAYLKDDVQIDKRMQDSIFANEKERILKKNANQCEKIEISDSNYPSISDNKEIANYGKKEENTNIVWENESKKSFECPFCKKSIPYRALVCMHCGMIVAF